MKRELHDKLKDIARCDAARGGIEFKGVGDGGLRLYPHEIFDVVRLALRATDPDMVMVPREDYQKLANFYMDMASAAQEDQT